MEFVPVNKTINNLNGFQNLPGISPKLFIYSNGLILVLNYLLVLIIIKGFFKISAYYDTENIDKLFTGYEFREIERNLNLKCVHNFPILIH